MNTPKDRCDKFLGNTYRTGQIVLGVRLHEIPETRRIRRGIARQRSIDDFDRAMASPILLWDRRAIASFPIFAILRFLSFLFYPRPRFRGGLVRSHPPPQGGARPATCSVSLYLANQRFSIFICVLYFFISSHFCLFICLFYFLAFFHTTRSGFLRTPCLFLAARFFFRPIRAVSSSAPSCRLSSFSRSGWLEAGAHRGPAMSRLEEQLSRRQSRLALVLFIYFFFIYIFVSYESDDYIRFNDRPLEYARTIE